jgi:hypothetical protein
MVVRVVLIQLKPEFRSYGQLRKVAGHALKVLSHVARVMEVKVHLASDPRTENDWDICILVRFASMQDPEVYRLDPIHRSFADNYLKPLQERIFVYHFEEFQPLA